MKRDFKREKELESDMRQLTNKYASEGTTPKTKAEMQRDFKKLASMYNDIVKMLNAKEAN